MFQTNQPDFDSIPEDPATGQEMLVNTDNADKANAENSSVSAPEFATLEAFTRWLDNQLVDLEANHEGFETISSVRGFYGR